jgi:hypothetical protein
MPVCIENCATLHATDIARALQGASNPAAVAHAVRHASRQLRIEQCKAGNARRGLPIDWHVIQPSASIHACSHLL